MPAAKPIQINIASPCSQNWGDMVPNGFGKHCAHCNKTVIDFTAWSDAALYEFFSKGNKQGCGRFIDTQLGRPIAIPVQLHSRLYRLTIALSLTLVLTQSPNAVAQNRPPKKMDSSIINQHNFQLPVHVALTRRELHRKAKVTKKLKKLIGARRYQIGVFSTNPYNKKNKQQPGSNEHP